MTARSHLRIAIATSCVIGPLSLTGAQTVQITGLPTHGQAGQVTGIVAGADPLAHEVAVYLHIEGGGWWTKPSAAMPTVPINLDGTFQANIGTGGLDEFASIFATSLVPAGTIPPLLLGTNTLDVGPDSLTSDHRLRYGTNLQFGGRTWGIKQSDVPVGPGGNRFSSDPNDVWVDQDGMHLTIHNHGGAWFSTEVVLTESLGYGTYSFQTNSRVDLLNRNATFGAFTWDPFGDDQRIPGSSNREIDFEDTRWGIPQNENTQFVVQPYTVPGNLQRFALPDLSADSALTRVLKWSPGKLEFIALEGHFSPLDFPESAVIERLVYEEDVGINHYVPLPGRENFRFNLWLNRSAPFGDQPVEVKINDFLYISSGDFDSDGDFDSEDIDALIVVIAGMSHEPNFDLTADGLVNEADLLSWLAAAGEFNLPSGNSYLIGDANLDGVVDGLDFILWNNFKFSQSAAWSHGDFNADGVVDGQDFIVWNENKFTSSEQLATVPEPGSVIWWIWVIALPKIRTRAFPAFSISAENMVLPLSLEVR